MPSRVLTAVAGVLVLGAVGCGGDNARPPATKTTAALPAGDACRSGDDGGAPRTFDAAVTVLGDGTHPGRYVDVTVCLVPSPRGARAVATLTATGGATLDRSSVEWPTVAPGRRQVATVRVEVPPGVRSRVSGAIQLYDATGEGSGRFVGAVELLGGPDAVFAASGPGERRLRELALQRELAAGRLTEEEYRDQLARLTAGDPNTPLTPVD